MYEVNFTLLQLKILRFLFMRSGTTCNQRALAKALKVSPTAVAGAIKPLVKQNLVRATKDKESKRLTIGLNRDNPRVFYLKRVENLRQIYESGLGECLSDAFPGSTVILFGSFCFGEDTTTSDIDLAVIGSKEKEVDLARFEKDLERSISLHFFESFGAIHKHLRENILSGIVLKGGVQL